MSYNILEVSKLIRRCIDEENLDGARNVCVNILLQDQHNSGILALFAYIELFRDHREQKHILSILKNVFYSDMLRRGDECLAKGDKNGAEAFYRATIEFEVVDDNSFAKLASIYYRGVSFEEQLTSVGHPILECYETPLGVYFLPTNAPGDLIRKYMAAGRISDEQIVNQAARFIKKGTVVLDLGANFGQMSIIFSKLTGPDGFVWSFEAQKYVHYILNKNLHANGADNVKAFNVAVMDNSEGYVRFPAPDFTIHPSYGSFGIDPSNREGEPVKKIRIDDLGVDKPISLMKIDIQGADLLAMKGARETINKHRMPIIFEYEKDLDQVFGTSLQDYVNFVNEIGYKFETAIGDSNFVIVPR